MERDNSTEIINLDKLTYAGSRDNLADLENTKRYTFVKGDIADRTLVKELFRTHDFDGIVHFAAETHVDNSITGPEPFIKTNINGTYTLLETARLHWNSSLDQPASQRFLHISTDEVFGSLGPYGHFSESSPYAPNSPYSASKAASDLLARSYAKTFGLNVAITNCSNNYGPYQHAEKLIPTVIRTALGGGQIPIYGKGTNVRDWLYVRDHCQALLRVYQEASPGSQYVIGGGNEYSNLELAKKICAQLDALRPKKDGSSYAAQITMVADRPGHDYRYAVDCSRIQEELGWVPETAFEKGLLQTVEWYVNRSKTNA